MKKILSVMIICLFFGSCIPNHKKFDSNEWLGLNNKSLNMPEYVLDHIEKWPIIGFEPIEFLDRNGVVFGVYGKEVFVATPDYYHGYLILDNGNRIVLRCVTPLNKNKSCRVLQKNGDKYFWVDTYYNTLNFTNVAATISGTGCDDPLVTETETILWPDGFCSWTRRENRAGLMLSIQGDSGKEYKALLKSKKYRYWDFKEDPWKENK